MVMMLTDRQVPDCEPGLMFTGGEFAVAADHAGRCDLTEPERLVRLAVHPGGVRACKHNP